jgi:hypothetical protein
MGADFTYAAVPECRITTIRHQELIKAIDALGEEHWDQNDYESLNDYKDALKKAVDHYEKVVPWKARDMSYFHVDGMPYRYALSGGMSWGDPG